MAASIPPNQAQKYALGQVELFQAADGQVSLDVRLEADTVWQSQGPIAELTRHVVTAQRLGKRPAHSPR